jgi:hypothetical protein
MNSKVQRTRMRRCIEAAASLVCCAGVELDSFGEVVEVLTEVGGLKEIDWRIGLLLKRWMRYTQVDATSPRRIL